MSKVSIHIYTVDYTRKEDDSYFISQSMFTTKKVAQKYADEMNEFHKERHPQDTDHGNTWEYRVHKHIVFKTW